MRYFLPLVGMALIGLLFWVGLGLQPALVPSPLIDRPVPEFALSQIDDADATFTHEQLRGRTTMIHVWATWCVTCRAEHPTLMAFARRGIVPIIGLNWKDNRDAGLRWLRALGNPYERTLYDPAGGVGIDWGVYGTPETFIVDAGGMIRYKHIGPLTDEIIERQIVPLVQSLDAAR